MNLKSTLTVALAAAALGTAAFATDAVQTGDSAKGAILTDADGMSLYTFDNDATSVSNCYDACAVNWPPLLAGDMAAAQGDYGVIERTDGTRQWTYKGQPLYTWVKDAAPGDITGDGVKGVWHLARP
jgi:predicted lipoprotein with Yx(FWY)xxD motif